MDTPRTLSRLEVALASVEPDSDQWPDMLVKLLDCSPGTAQGLLSDGADSVNTLQRIADGLGVPLGMLIGAERIPFTAFCTKAAIILENVAYPCWVVADRHAMPPMLGDSFVLRNLDETWIAARLLDKVDGRPLRLLHIELVEPTPLPRSHIKILGYSPDPTMAAELRQALQQHGYSAEILGDIGAAIDTGRRNPPDVLLIDDGPASASSLSIDAPIRHAIGRPVRVVSMSALMPVRPQHVLERVAYSMGYYGCPRTVAAALLTLAQIVSIANAAPGQTTPGDSHLEVIP
ncbi:hypothetical protein [Chitinimonas lacunae]|uniref:Response regulatory domain-containing protein n=1 Tax=Chitinimonas lacunae TaxID=1963018 RepID=A0ABV8MIM7_9NEIS